MNEHPENLCIYIGVSQFVNTFFELDKRYYEQLDAPAGKQLIWFEKSAHSIIWDEPGKLAKTLIDIEQNLPK